MIDRVSDILTFQPEHPCNVCAKSMLFAALHLPVVDEVCYVALTCGVNAAHQAAALRRQLKPNSLQQQQQQQ
jgi:hypothetical protein